MRQCLVLMICVALCTQLLHTHCHAQSATTMQADVVIYGGTPAGIAAAIAAGKQERTVILVEPYRRIGGLMTNGLSHADFRSFEGLSGSYAEFIQRVQDYYIQKYGPDSPQAECFRGTHAEPHVNQLLFESWLGELPNVKILTQHRLQSADTTSILIEGGNRTGHINSIVVADESDSRGSSVPQTTISADIFIDASYEGDLLAAAGIPFHVGREGQGQYQESLAPEAADDQLQGYNFRFVMTQVPDNRILAKKPDGYDRSDYEPLLALFEADQLDSVFCAPKGGIYKYQPPQLPNGKYDINDVSRGLVRLSLPQINNGWPTGSVHQRKQLFAEHLLHQVGMLYFLQNDTAVPATIQNEARSWGFCRDEFVDTDHLPEQLYIREGRRMIGQHVFTENDTNHAPGDARTILRTDAIACGDYGPNCHGTDHEGPRIGGKHTGEFYKRVAPYQIRYGVLLPQHCDNLLVPTACSASHVGFCALRLEPIWMSLGQAAGVAAGLASKQTLAVQDVVPAQIQQILHRHGSATIYIADIPPAHSDFAATQWWGTLGGFHGLASTPPSRQIRGENFFGQYYNAFPLHSAQLDEPLDDDLKRRWTDLARQNGIEISGVKATARGDWIRQAYWASQTR